MAQSSVRFFAGHLEAHAGIEFGQVGLAIGSEVPFLANAIEHSAQCVNDDLAAVKLRHRRCCLLVLDSGWNRTTRDSLAVEHGSQLVALGRHHGRVATGQAMCRGIGRRTKSSWFESFKKPGSNEATGRKRPLQA